MSDKNPATAPPTAPPIEPAAKASVIRILETAHETAHERLMWKLLPAWVISGAVNIALIALLLVIGGRSGGAQPVEKIVATSIEKEDEAADKDLTNEDAGLDSKFEAALPEIEQLADATVQAAVTMDNVGKPDALDNDTNALALPGLNASDLTAAGVLGEKGDALMGTGGEMGNIIAGSLAGRSGATKSRLLREGGGNEATERAVAWGLAWLAKQQKSDGSWVYDAGRKEEIIAATGMGLLPFLAAGETHKKAGKYQKTVANGLAYLIRNVQISGPNAGKFTGAGTMYAHAIGTIALCEAYGMTKDKSLLLAPAQATINYIQKGQGTNGSWGYSAGSNGDTSIVGWQIQALKAAELSKDIVVDKQVIKKAIDFLDLAAGGGSKKSTYGYNDNARAAPATSLTAVGLLCRQYIDKWGPDNIGLAEGVLGLMRKAPVATKNTPDMYYYYYATQVVHFFEGEEWKTWNEGPKGADGIRKGGMRDWLVGIQVTKPGDNHGSFDPDPQWIGRGCGRLGTTAMCILTLEVYYRHLPLYKRSNPAEVKLVDAAK